MKKFITTLAACAALICATSCGNRNSHIDTTVEVAADSVEVVVDSIAVNNAIDTL